MHNVPDDVALAWELAATARPHLSRVDADGIYIILGIGETFAAIDALITAIARLHVPLSDDVVARTAAWLDCYRGQDAEPRLRGLLGDVGSTSTRWSTTPCGDAPQAVPGQLML